MQGASTDDHLSKLSQSGEFLLDCSKPILELVPVLICISFGQLAVCAK